MIVRLDVQQHTSPDSYWQLKRCQVQRGALMEDVSEPAFFRPMRFGTLEEAVRHAKRATFSYLEKKRHTGMPDQIDWRIIQDAHISLPHVPTAVISKGETQPFWKQA